MKNSVKHIRDRGESGGFYDGWPKKRPLIALVEQFRIIRFPLFSLPVFPAFARPEAQSPEADFPFGAATARAKCSRLGMRECLQMS